MIIACHYLLKNTKILAITLYPFIIIQHSCLRQNATLINHEKIHLRQQLEMLVIPFYVFYVIEYWIRLSRCREKQKAYRSISFEREAYENEGNQNYLKIRSFWGFRKYLRDA